MTVLTVSMPTPFGSPLARSARRTRTAQLKADVEALVGALTQLTMDNFLLCQQLSVAAGVVRALPRPGIDDATHPVPPNQGEQ